MNNIEKNVLEFLKSGMVYSDGAIMKNLGIDSIELEEIYISLTNQGYLESYDDFLKRNPDYEKGEEENSCGGCSSGGCSSKGGCSSGGCSSGGCSSKDEDIDYSKIKVLTEKAFTYTY
ncbi:hypothetical protein [uncultured Cetobacterium sp.]|uniref:hypothetical protein n=1 Tax=uncultured Cetobacterium sp. TaxID=527638 RepID=UPI00261E00E7|nr:hypothetical protein [uncultured Cetobacterium sp.]